MARRAASRGASPSRRPRSTFSTTMMASSTTMPIASTMPNSESTLSEKPSAASAAKVPISETGIATSGMSDTRQLWRKSSTTSTTRPAASKSVRWTSATDSSTKTVGSYAIRYSRPSGKPRPSSSIAARTRCAVARAFEPGRWLMAMTDGLRVVQVRVHAVVASAELHPRQVAHADDAPVLAGVDHDVLELGGILEPAERVHRQLEAPSPAGPAPRRSRRPPPARSARAAPPPRRLRSARAPRSSRDPARRACCTRAPRTR